MTRTSPFRLLTAFAAAAGHRFWRRAFFLSPLPCGEGKGEGELGAGLFAMILAVARSLTAPASTAVLALIAALAFASVRRRTDNTRPALVPAAWKSPAHPSRVRRRTCPGDGAIGSLFSGIISLFRRFKFPVPQTTGNLAGKSFGRLANSVSTLHHDALKMLGNSKNCAGNSLFSGNFATFS